MAVLDEMLRLPETLDTAGALSLRDTLLAIRGKAARLDASDVTKMNGFAAEVLVSAHRLWADDGAEFVISGPSEAFTATLADLGLAEHLGAAGTGPTDGGLA